MEGYFVLEKKKGSFAFEKWYESSDRMSTTKLRGKLLLEIVIFKSQIENFSEGSTQSCLVAT